MDKYLYENYALFGSAPEQNKGLTARARGILANPLHHYLLFGVVMLVVCFLSANKVLPYSLQSGLAITFAYSLASVGFCLLMGYSGLASLGTGGFMGIGCYSIHFVMTEAGLPFGVALVAALAIAIVLGLIVGVVSLRIEGIYLVILTLGLSEILRNLYIAVQDSIYLSTFKLFGITVPRSASGYVVTVLLVIVMMLTHNLIVSPTGRAMLAMKNSTAAAQAMGISLMKYRLLAFVICTVYAVLSGMMLMITIRSAMATDASGFYALITSLNILAAVIIGGFRSIWGAVFGTFIMYGLQTMLLNRIPFLQENPVIITFVSGILVVLVVMFYPGGMAQLVQEVRGKLRKSRAARREAKYGKD